MEAIDVHEVAKRLGLHVTTIRRRIKAGWPIERVVNAGSQIGHPQTMENPWKKYPAIRRRK